MEERASLVLVVHPEVEVASRIAQLLDMEDLLLVHTRSAQRIDELIRDARPEIILCRVDEKVGDGRYVYELFCNEENSTRVIFLVDRDEIKRARDLVLKSHGYDYFVVNPAFDALHLEVTVRQAIKELSLEQEHQAWQRTLSSFIDEGLVKEIEIHRDGILNDIRHHVDRFRDGIAPEGGGGPVEITNPEAFEKQYSGFRDDAVKEVIYESSDKVRASLQKSLSEVPQKARELPVMSMEERLAGLPSALERLKQQVNEEPGHPHDEKDTSMHVLVVCGRCPSLAGAQDLLRKAGCVLSIRKKMDWAEISDHGDEFDAVIVDISSENDPRRMVERIRKAVRSDCIIIAASMKVSASLLRGCRRAGADDVILLPVKPDCLKTRLERHFRTRLAGKCLN